MRKVSNAQNPSKYRNAVPTPAKKDESYLFAANFLSKATPQGSDFIPIKANPTHFAFKLNAGNGANVGILPYSSIGKTTQQQLVSLPGSSQLCDMDWCPDATASILATASEDGSVRLWKTRDQTTTTNSNTGISELSPIKSFSAFEKRVDNILFNPMATRIAAASSMTSVSLFNIDTSCASPSIVLAPHPDLVYGMAWNKQGSLLSTTCKDTNLRVFDPRTSFETPTMMTKCHENGIKPLRAIFLASELTGGNGSALFTTGFSMARDREFAIWDSRNMNEPVVRNKLDTGIGSLTPLYDDETNQVYLVGKGDTIVRWVDVAPGLASTVCGQPFVSQNSILGGGLVPKLGLKVMECEIARLLFVTSDTSTITPVSMNMLRKSYTDFHSDLFPDTKAMIDFCTPDDWLTGKNGQITKVSLKPAGKQVTSTTTSSAPASATLPSVQEAVKSTAPIKSQPQQPSIAVTDSSSKTNTTAPVFGLRKASDESRNGVTKSTSSTFPIPEIKSGTSTVASSRRSTISSASGGYGRPTLRFINAKMVSLVNFPDNRALSTTVNLESDPLTVNAHFVAIAISGPGGRIGMLKYEDAMKKNARLERTQMGCIVCGSELGDFKLSPFTIDGPRYGGKKGATRFGGDCLLTGTDDGKLRVFRTSITDGLRYDSNEPEIEWTAHLGRITVVAWHPVVEGLVFSASPELLGVDGSSMPCIKAFDLTTSPPTLLMTYSGFTDFIMSMTISADGKQLITASKDGQLRVFNVISGKVEYEAKCQERGCRVVWAAAPSIPNQITKDRIVSVGFTRGNQREALVYEFEDKNRELKLVSRTDVGTSPALLSPNYDEDTGLFYLYARGSTSAMVYDIHPVTGEIQFLIKLETSSAIGQSIAFFNKRYCDIKNVEIGRAVKCTNNNTLEYVSFTIPRAKPQYFQDDLFTPTRDVEMPDKRFKTPADWFNPSVHNSCQPVVVRIDLKPEEMTRLSDAPKNTAESAALAAKRAEMMNAVKEESDSAEKHFDKVFMLAKMQVDSSDDESSKPEKKKVDELVEVKEEEWE